MNEILPETIEVKLAFVLEDTANAFAILGLSDPPKEERRIHFFDTENLVLFDRGLILRVRQTVAGGDTDDATFKVPRTKRTECRQPIPSDRRSQSQI
jgi:hypothetical protein